MARPLKFNAMHRRILELLDDGVHIHKVMNYSGAYPWVYRLEPDDTSNRYDLATMAVSWLLTNKLVSTLQYVNPDDGNTYLKLELTDAGREALKAVNDD